MSEIAKGIIQAHFTEMLIGTGILVLIWLIPKIILASIQRLDRRMKEYNDEIRKYKDEHTD